MKIRVITLIILVTMLVLPVASYAQETDAVAVIMARTEALNAGDAEAAAAFFADDATYKINDPPPNARELYSGREEILGRLLELVAVNANMEMEVQQVDGDNVTTLTRFADDPLNEMGVDFIEGIEQYTVRDGKITSYEWTLTEESGAKIAAAMAPPETMPESGGVGWSAYTISLVVGGLALMIGLSLAVWYRRSISKAAT